MRLHSALPYDLHAKVSSDRRTSHSANSFWADLRNESIETEKEIDKRSLRDLPREHSRGGQRQPQLAAVRMAFTASTHQSGANDRTRRSTPEEMPASIREAVNPEKDAQPVAAEYRANGRLAKAAVALAAAAKKAYEGCRATPSPEASAAVAPVDSLKMMTEEVYRLVKEKIHTLKFRINEKDKDELENVPGLKEGVEQEVKERMDMNEKQLEERRKEFADATRQTEEDSWAFMAESDAAMMVQESDARTRTSTGRSGPAPHVRLVPRPDAERVASPRSRTPPRPASRSPQGSSQFATPQDDPTSREGDPHPAMGGSSGTIVDDVPGTMDPVSLIAVVLADSQSASCIGLYKAPRPGSQDPECRYPIDAISQTILERVLKQRALRNNIRTAASRGRLYVEYKDVPPPKDKKDSHLWFRVPESQLWVKEHEEGGSAAERDFNANLLIPQPKNAESHYPRKSNGPPGRTTPTCGRRTSKPGPGRGRLAQRPPCPTQPPTIALKASGNARGCGLWINTINHGHGEKECAKMNGVSMDDFEGQEFLMTNNQANLCRTHKPGRGGRNFRERSHPPGESYSWSLWHSRGRYPTKRRRELQARFRRWRPMRHTHRARLRGQRLPRRCSGGLL